MNQKKKNLKEKKLKVIRKSLRKEWQKENRKNKFRCKIYHKKYKKHLLFLLEKRTKVILPTTK